MQHGFIACNFPVSIKFYQIKFQHSILNAWNWNTNKKLTYATHSSRKWERDFMVCNRKTRWQWNYTISVQCLKYRMCKKFRHFLRSRTYGENAWFNLLHIFRTFSKVWISTHSFSAGICSLEGLRKLSPKIVIRKWPILRLDIWNGFEIKIVFQ